MLGCAIAAITLGSLGCGGSAGGAGGSVGQFWALTVGNLILRASLLNPNQVSQTLVVAGLQGGEDLLAIDVRPSNGVLYALGSTSRLYTIDTVTAFATQVGAGPFTTPLSGTHFGFDFNPVADRIRIVSDTGQNLRINPDTGSVVATDASLAFSNGDPNFGATPAVTACAYDQNVAGSATTSLFAIDSSLDSLVRIGSVNGTPVSPNSGELFTLAPLSGVTTGPNIGFDIDGVASSAFVSLTLPGATRSSLFALNLASGFAASRGVIGGADVIRDIALIP